MLRECLRSMSKGDVLIASSFRNYSPEVVDVAAKARALGVQVIVITDGPLSPLKPSAHVCLELADDSSKPFRSLVAPLCLAQALVVSVGHQLAEKPTTTTGRSAPRKKGTL